MSNSSLVSYTKISPHRTSPRNQKIDKITIHHMAGTASIEACGQIFQTREASSNYGVGNDGRVAMYVEEKDRSWASSNAANDHRAVTIEVANSAVNSNWPVSDTALDATIELCVDICRRNDIEKLNFTGDKTGNLTQHCYFAATACPGPYLKSKFQYIADEVNKRLGCAEQPAETKPAETQEEVCKVNLKTLKKGSEGDPVKALQTLLIGYGYSCGSWGADGDFGSATENAVKAYQKAKGLVVDGIVGPATWGKLLGV